MLADPAGKLPRPISRSDGGGAHSSVQGSRRSRCRPTAIAANHGPKDASPAPQPAKIIVAAAMTAAQALGRGKPIGRNVRPEEPQEGLGLLALAIPACIGMNQEQPAEIRAIVRGTAKLMNPKHRGRRQMASKRR